MPRKVKDPIVPVMQYFETASVESARTALEVVTEIVRRRGSAVMFIRPPTPRTRSTSTTPAPVSTTELDPVVGTLLPSLPKARVRKPKEVVTAPMPAATLPGVQATVGD